MALRELALRRSRLIKWSILNIPRSAGGMGIINLETKKCVPLEQMVVQSFKRGWHMAKVNKEKIFRR